MALFSRKRTRPASVMSPETTSVGEAHDIVDAYGAGGTDRDAGGSTAGPRSAAAEAAVAAALAAQRPVFNPIDPSIEREILAIGGRILDIARGKKAGIFSSQFWSDKLMDWAMKDEAFKIQFFRFVDTFPALKTPDQVHDHLVDYLSQPGVTPPPGMDLGIKAGGLAKGLFTKQMTSQITSMAQKFIAGSDAASSVDQLRKLWKNNICFTVDLLGEACISARLADEYLEKYLDLVNNLPAQVADFPANPRLETDYLGPIPRVNVSIKLTSLYWNVDPIAPERSIDAVMERVAPILQAAKQKGVFINFDIEQFEFKDLTLDLVERACEKYDFEAGLALQAYLRSGPDDARRLISWAKRTGRQLTVRLVKGAYWDYETIHAERTGHPVPVWSRKPETDACYERMVSLFVENMPRSKNEGGIKLALGSHNARSIAHALATAKHHGFPDNTIELQMLHGMGDQLKHAVSDLGYRLREYVPVGEMLVGMAYFVRRLLENTSNESWLRAGFSDNADTSVLLANPLTKVREGEPDPGITLIATAPERHRLTPAINGLGSNRPFENEPYRDFAQREVRDRFASAVRNSGGGPAATRNPATAADNGSMAVVSDARESIGAAADARAAWAATPVLVRARVLVRAAEILRRRRDELAAMLIRATGKTWRDADAEVCDAIDALEYYARIGVVRFVPGRLGRFIGELNESAVRPRGVVAVITPWNFPLSTPAGFLAPALVAGNTVVFKPASATRGVARVLYDILQQAMEEVGNEDASLGHRDRVHVLNFVPGPGEVVGPAIVQDPRVSTIAFAGSRRIAESIQAAATIVADGSSSYHFKNVLCFTGGKNSIVVDASADIGEAVTAVRDCAFAFAGQQATACRRVLVHESAFDAFLDKLCESTAEMRIGDPAMPGTVMGPVISSEAAHTILQQVQAVAADTNYTPALVGALPPADQLAAGWTYVPPHILMERMESRRERRDVRRPVENQEYAGAGGGGQGGGVATMTAAAVGGSASRTPLQVSDPLDDWEVFGPVLGVVEVGSFEEGLSKASRTGYRLTGGVFSRKPSNITMAHDAFRVGTLYINAPITRARVGRQPLGGVGLAGHGLQIGGPRFLDHFVVPATVIENTMRRGFAPEL